MEIRISLNEELFTNLCKFGYITKQLPEEGRTDIRFTNSDIKSLSLGEILTKEVGSIKILIALQDIGNDLVIEIVKRSPIYSDVFNY